MTRLPALKAIEVIAALRKLGYDVDHQTGSHVILYKKGRLPISVPRHTGDLRRGTLFHIIRSAGLSIEEFLNLV